MRISCRLSWPAPAQTYASSAAPAEGAARTESRADPACRLHARVRQHARDPDETNSGELLSTPGASIHHRREEGAEVSGWQHKASAPVTECEK